MYATLKKMKPEEVAKYEQLQSSWIASTGGVPDAPFKDTWYQLSLKRILKYAADNGYERVGLTTGEQQAKRYDLSKQVGEVHYNPDTQKLFAYEKNGFSTILNETVEPNKLSDYIGKEAAEKLLNKKPTVVPTDKGDVMHHILKNADLKIGGEGMKKYYDEIYPKFLEKYSKKWDAGVGETKISTEASPKSWAYFRDWFSKNHSDVGGSSTALANWQKGEDSKYVREFLKQNKVQEPIRYIDITPKMKEGVKKGQPLAAAEQTPEMLASGGLDYADPFKNPLLESTIG